ncbi:MAG: hypothetical protein ACREC9_10680 [Methylocella sp.]
MRSITLKRTPLLILCLATVALTATTVKLDAQAAAKPHLRGYSIVIPWKGGTADDAMAASKAGATIPLASFSFLASKDGGTYTNVIVGQSPFLATHFPTRVKILLVPMKLHIAGHVFDSTAPNSCGGSLGNSDLANFQNSPILSPVTFDGGLGAGHAALVNGVNMGRRTYNNTHRRAEFLKAIGGPTSLYGTHYDITVAATQNIFQATTVGHSAIIVDNGGCAVVGGLDINFFDTYLTTTVLNAVGGDPTYFVIFLMRDVVFYQGNTSNCCFLYHGALNNMQTYSPIDYDTTGEFGTGFVNVSVAAHEIGEWLDDPLGTNPTPPWGNIGQVSGCQNNWEVGDPLTGTLFPAIRMPNGVTYNPQENVFWSWFYSKDHGRAFQNMTAGGKYSMNGTFGGPSMACPPGGTFPN